MIFLVLIGVDAGHHCVSCMLDVARGFPGAIEMGRSDEAGVLEVREPDYFGVHLWLLSFVLSRLPRPYVLHSELALSLTMPVVTWGAFKARGDGLGAWEYMV